MKRSPFDLLYQNKSIDSKIIAALERIAQAFRVLLWNESKELALSPIQIQVLIFLLYHSPDKRKVSYLAGEFNMTKATISDTIKTLEQKELITKEYEELDSRSYSIHLTEKGKACARQTALFTNEIRKPIDKLPGDDKESLLLSLIGIIDHLNKAGVITLQRMCYTCTYYNNDKKPFCKLLNKELQVTDLRVDCPEHDLLQKPA